MIDSNSAQNPLAQPSRTSSNGALASLAALAAVSLVLFVVLVAAHGWPSETPLVAAGLSLALLSALSGTGVFLTRRGRVEQAAWLAIGGSIAAGGVVSTFLAGTTLPIALTLLLLLPILGLTALPSRRIIAVFLLGLMASGAMILLDTYGSLEKQTLAGAESIALALDVVLLGVLVAIIIRQFANYTLRAKLILSFLFISLVPIGLLAYLNNQSTRTALINEADQKLFSAATQMGSSLDALIESNLDHVHTESQLTVFQQYLGLAPGLRSGHDLEASAKDTLLVLASRDSDAITSYALLDVEGRNLLDTDDEQMSVAESDRDYVDVPVATGRAYASHVQLAPLSGEPSLYFAAPVLNPAGRVAGVLRVRYRASVLQDLLVENAGLAGPDSFAVLFDEDQIHLAHSTAPETLLKAVGPLDPGEAEALVAVGRLPDLSIDQLTTNLPDLESKLDAAATGQPFFVAEDVATGNRLNRVAVAMMETKPWLVAFLQPEDVLLAPVDNQARSVLVIAVIIAGGAALAALALSQVLARPIGVLTGIATRLAQGDLEARVPAETGDEIGAMAQTFNAMADRLRELVTGLEGRVAERTHDLERRARQLQAAAEVSKGAAGIRDPKRLLDEAVRLISERFGYYHTGVFLIDDEGEYAVLQAASSEGGRVMLARRHALPVGKLGLIGYVTGTGKARVASDVETDTVYYANPDLPDTRSELALPLAIGDRVIGALDVQSLEPDAFDENDAVILQTMADQLAIAIENARLLDRQTRVAGQRRQVIDLYSQLAQELSYDQLLAELSKRVRETFDYTRVTLALVEGEELVVRSSDSNARFRPTRLGDRMAFGQGLLGRAVALRGPVTWSTDTGQGAAESSSTEASHAGPMALAVPLISRGSILGALSVERREGQGLNEDDNELVQLLASQVAVSLENARLFEETERSLRQLDALFREQATEAWSHLLKTRQALDSEASYVAGQADLITHLEGESRNIETPIALRGEVIGRLNVEGLGAGDWTEEELMILEAVAGEVADQLEQIRLLQEIRRRATHMETAAEIARAATGVLDEDALLQRATALIHERFRYDHVSVYLFGDEGQAARLAESAGEGSDALKARYGLPDPPAPDAVLRVAQTGRAFVVDQTGAARQPESAIPPDSGSEGVIPLKIGKRVLGAIHVIQQSASAFDAEEIAVLEVLSDQLAVAIQNARLFQETLSRAEREKAVVEISSKIRASGDIDAMLQTAVHEIREQIGAKMGRIQLVSEPHPAAGEVRREAGPEGDDGSDTNHRGETNGRAQTGTLGTQP